MESSIPLLSKIIFVALSSICLAFIGMLISRFFIPQNSGFAGGASVLAYGIGGFLLGLMGSILGISLLNATQVRAANIVLGIFALLFAIWVVIRSQQVNQTTFENPPKPKVEN